MEVGSSKVVASSEIFTYNAETDVVISELYPKTMDSLYFSSCNSGNPDMKNTGTAFRDIIDTNEIIAWDGGTIFNYNTGELEAGGYGGWWKEWYYQPTYYRYVETDYYGKPTRERQGKVYIEPR